MDYRVVIALISKVFLLAAVVMLMSSLLSCIGDYGVVTKEVVIIEEVIEQYETVGALGYEHGVVYDQVVDILLLIDESGSMIDNQEQLSANMPSIYNILTGSSFTNLKWRIGITSTDSFSPIYAYVDHDDPDASIKLLTLTSFLENHATEAGLDAAVKHMAWDDTGFFRRDADALFVFISDEEDQSAISTSSYLSIMSQAKEEPFLALSSSLVHKQVSASSSDYADCGAYSDMYVGYRYMYVSDVSVDLCDATNWTNILDPAKDHVPTLNEKWYLDDGVPVYPQEDNISVFFDDALVHDWFYQPADNTVNLFTVPESGTYISIVYLIEPV